MWGSAENLMLFPLYLRPCLCLNIAFPFSPYHSFYNVLCIVLFELDGMMFTLSGFHYYIKFPLPLICSHCHCPVKPFYLARKMGRNKLWILLEESRSIVRSWAYSGEFECVGWVKNRCNLWGCDYGLQSWSVECGECQARLRWRESVSELRH